jgi:hypothetical protein
MSLRLLTQDVAMTFSSKNKTNVPQVWASILFCNKNLRDGESKK